MTMIELQNILGETMTKVTDESLKPNEHEKATKTAEAVARLAKQMINNADVVLRTDKLCSRHDRIDKMVGDGK